MAEQSPLKMLPAVHVLAKHPDLQSAAQKVPRSLLIESIREVLQELRQSILHGHNPAGSTDIGELVERVKERLDAYGASSIKPVINATGVVLHTNLARAPLSQNALNLLVEVGRQYSNLEFSLTAGVRGHRHDHVALLLKRLTGGESAVVVNNNAAAVLLILDSFAKGKEVIVSRGELVEIGGGFRIPEVMSKSGALLREVGTTNRTTIKDYEQAITPDTALLMKVHPSNFRIVGFTRETGIEALAGLGKKHHLPVVFDLGSGALVDLGRAGKGETTPAQAIRAGADLVCFSGDKLMGGPQAGIIVGNRTLIEQLEMNPLLRALRVCKLTLAALVGTLRSYLHDVDARNQEIPVLYLINRDPEEIKKVAMKLLGRLRRFAGGKHHFAVMQVSGRIGGGAGPLTKLPSYAVAVSGENFNATRFIRLLLDHDPPIVAVVRNERVLFDLRTVFPDQVMHLVQFFREYYLAE